MDDSRSGSPRPWAGPGTSPHRKPSRLAQDQDVSSLLLAGLQLLAVQPAALRAHPNTPQQQQATHLVAPPFIEQLEAQHEVLLHLEATLTGDAQAAGPWRKAAAAAARPTSCPASSNESGCAAAAEHMATTQALPLPLAAAELQVLALSRQMQLLHRQQTSLLHMLQQQGQLEEVQAAAGASRDGSGSCAVLLNVHVTLPCQPTDRLLDCMHLVLLVAANNGSNNSSSSSSLRSAQVDARVIADVPLLVVPAVAQQEVQQLLLPAMRQEVQAAQQMQLQQQGLDLQLQSATELALSSMAVEHAAWQHFHQMANDVYAVVQLSAAISAAANEAACSSSSSEARVEPCVVVMPAAGAAPAAEAAAAATPMASLVQLANGVLFPLLLPFLATQGLHNMLRLLLMCLPHQLQLQWQQQQFARLQYLIAAAPPPLRLPAPLQQDAEQEQLPEAATQSRMHEQQQQQQQATTAAAAASSAARGSIDELSNKPISSSSSSSKAACRQVGFVSSTEDAADASVEAAMPPAKLKAKAAEQPAGKTATPAAATTSAASQRKAYEKPSTAAAAAAGAADIDSAAAATAAAAGVPWYLPLVQFDQAVEQRYITWKHSSLLHLDHVGAFFGLLYLALMLKRLLQDRCALFYFCVILTKVLPHVPLMLGFKQPFLRHREQWLLSIAPCMLLLTVGMSLPALSQGAPALLLPNRAYRAYWASRGELQTNILRPFLQHMRVQPYLAYVLLDAAVTAWVFGQVFGMWAAVLRMGMAAGVSLGICWGFDLHMRRRFVAALARQQRARLHQD